MKFSHKVFFSTLIAIALVFSIGSSVLLNSVFHSELRREANVTIEENQMLCYSFLTAASGTGASSAAYDLEEQLPISAVRRIAWTVEESNGSCIRVSDAAGKTLYVSKEFRGNQRLYQETSEEKRSWMLFSEEENHYLQASGRVSVDEKIFYIENLRDVTLVMESWHRYMRLYQVLSLAMVAVAAVIVLLLSLYLTRPMKQLSLISRRIAEGEYQLRCDIHSQDEIGALTEDFNAMADSLEAKLHQMEEATRRQEDFVASFAHELKTPLTSIIGYSDMLRTRILPPEQQFKAAEYIYSEGKRLESLSHKLLELIVYRRQTMKAEYFDALPWLRDVAALEAPSYKESGIQLELKADEGRLWGDPDLLRSLLINLCDNARKASKPGDRVILSGEKTAEGYRLSVTDQGGGIAPEELLRITEPFYMVDKSRARAQNGAGLGLSLCSAVAELHHAALEFESRLGEGTRVSVELREVQS